MDGFVAPAPRPRLALPRRSLRGAGDDRLVAQIRSADDPAARNAFEILYDRHHRGVLAFCRHMLGSLEEAEDAVQHTFSSAYRALLADDREIAVRAWLYAIARNRCLSMLAARREQVALDDVEALLPSTAGLAREVEQRSDLRELLADMQRLPDDQRAALVLSELEAHSHREIAEILGVGPSKVKALVFQARETLMIRRQARDTDCTQIREQLSVLRGGALRRRELRRHVEACAGCQVFEAEVRRQRAGIAVLLPVAPTIALKQGTLASAFAAGSASSAVGVGTLSGSGAVVLGAKAIGVKALVALAVAGGAGGGGYVAVGAIEDARKDPAPATAPQVQRGPASSAPGAAGTAPAAAGTAPAAAGTAPAAVSPAVTPATAVPGSAVSSDATATNNAAAGVTGAERATDRSDGRSGGTASAGRSENGTTNSARAIDNKTTAAAKRAAARARREAAMVRPESAAGVGAETGAEQRAAALSRADALQEAARRRQAAEAAQRAKERAAAQTPPTTAPDVATDTPPLPALAAERRPERGTP